MNSFFRELQILYDIFSICALHEIGAFIPQLSTFDQTNFSTERFFLILSEISMTFIKSHTYFASKIVNINQLYSVNENNFECLQNDEL